MYMGETGHNTCGWYRAIVESMERHNIGWTFWPVKKPDASCWLPFRTPEGWKETVVAFAESDRGSYKELMNRPERAAAIDLLRRYAENCKFGNCAPDAEYLQSLNLSVP